LRGLSDQLFGDFIAQILAKRQRVSRGKKRDCIYADCVGFYEHLFAQPSEREISRINNETSHT